AEPDPGHDDSRGAQRYGDACQTPGSQARVSARIEPLATVHRPAYADDDPECTEELRDDRRRIERADRGPVASPDGPREHGRRQKGGRDPREWRAGVKADRRRAVLPFDREVVATEEQRRDRREQRQPQRDRREQDAGAPA